MDQLVVAAVLIAVVVMLVFEVLRADLVALCALGALALSGVLTPEQAFSGFSNPATITIAAMFVLTAGLEASGVISFVGDRIVSTRRYSEFALLGISALIVAPISAFINNTAAVAVFVPLAIRAAHASRISPSRILMPMAFIAVLGGTCTLVGTSTNILVSSLAAQHGEPPFSMFEFSKLGLAMLAVGAVYLLFVGRRIIPERVSTEEGYISAYHLGRYLSELLIPAGSEFVGRTLRETKLGERHDVDVLGLVRDGVPRGVPGDTEALREGDVLLVRAHARAIGALTRIAGLVVRPARQLGDDDILGPEAVLVETVVAPNSALESRSLKEVGFRHRFGATCLAVRRRGVDLLTKVGRLPLRFGDELLLIVRNENLDALRRQSDLLVVQEVDVPTVRARPAIVASCIVALVIAGAASGVAPIVVTATVGAVAMVLTGCLPLDRLYRAVDWKIIVLLGGMIPLGLAMETSGAADVVVRMLFGFAADAAPRLLLALLFGLTLLLTGFMSNTATAALVVPLAIGLAARLGLDPRPFLIAVTFAASAAFYTPVGYQTNLLVYSPGNYRFFDYLRVGGPLNVLLFATAVLLIPIFFPFRPK